MCLFFVLHTIYVIISYNEHLGCWLMDFVYRLPSAWHNVFPSSQSQLASASFELCWTNDYGFSNHGYAIIYHSSRMSSSFQNHSAFE